MYVKTYSGRDQPHQAGVHPSNRVTRLIKETYAEWKDDNVPLHAAALAYYTIFSLAPLLLIAIAVAGAVFGEEAARGELVRQIQGLVGKEGAVAIQPMVENASQPGSGSLLATVIGFLLLMLGASGVFGQLQMALNKIWKAEPKPRRGFQRFLITRFLSFAMVLVIGCLLLVSLLLSSLHVAVGSSFSRLMPRLPDLGQGLNLLISLGVITVLFASIYKYLPDVRDPWRDLWVGQLPLPCCLILARLPLACTSETAVLAPLTTRQAHWSFC